MDRKHAGARNELIATVWLLGQGYDVFRNVSQHGLVDIVAMKGGETFHFDVKSQVLRVNGDKAKAALSADQIALGVKAINVYPDATCEIDWAPAAKGHNGQRICACCSTKFHSNSANTRFCSSSCKVVAWRARKAKILELREIRP